MFLDLLIKDVQRTRRNPWPILIFLAIPLSLTGLTGFVFAPKSDSSALGQIKLAVVDEDDSFVGGFLRSAFNQGEASEHFAPQIMSRPEAMALLQDNKISAMVVIPAEFTRTFLRGESPPPLELVKNPAQSSHPAIVEELVGALTEALSAVSSVFGDELQEVRALMEAEGDRFDFRAMSRLMEQTGNRLGAVEDFVSPPLISYRTGSGATEATTVAAGGSPEGTETDAEDEVSPLTEVFSYILPGMAAMFLLMIGDGATRDLYKESRLGTLSRYRSLRPGLFLFVFAKITHALGVTLVCAVILFGGSWLIFGIQWQHPLWLAGLATAFSFCACGFMAFLAALAGNEKRADMMNSLLVFGTAFVGGSMVPVNVLPGFVRTYLSPLTPNYWFIEGVRRMQFDAVDTLVINSILALTAAGVVLVALSAWRFTDVMRRGIRR